MRVYWEIIKLYFLESVVYPYEVVAQINRKIIPLCGVLLFWSIVSKTSNETLNTRELLSYFLIAEAVSELVMGRLQLARWALKRIKYGEFNTFLIRPVNILAYLYSIRLGMQGLSLSFAALSFIAGILVHPSISILSLLLFSVFLILALLISIFINVLVTSFGFHTAEASSFKNVVSHVITVLSGSLIPISFFPETIASFVRLTPFPSMVYGPATALKTNSLTPDILSQLSISLLWVAILFILTSYIWNLSIKKYEAIGI